ncbi:hypothetical protein [Reichenbachiella sp.]|uniref:hypothetical protein n=1 Tax=Reichenbachiella sp. TaxID=2184521 RepID=UPI003B5CBDC0
MSKYRHYFALEKQLHRAGYPVSRMDLIRQYSGDEMCSLQEMSLQQYNQFIQWIRITFKSHLDAAENAQKKSIKTAVHYLCLMGMTTSDDKPDFTRINSFVKNIGSNNPKKETLNKLTPGQLNKVVTQIKSMYQKEISR